MNYDVLPQKGPINICCYTRSLEVVIEGPVNVCDIVVAVLGAVIPEGVSD